ncbi:MAG: CDP-alcohol phosphatidyltransferase family protein [Clostridia bacterium]|nr:CDP-alcohol phosphatidyltransferase family protein [Clostridia bacterium]
MIGVYDYTVILTYISLLSAGTGIIVSLSGYGHPYVGIFFLLVCGLCDAFDGKVARTKKGRTDVEKKFGIQIDSLSDLVAFGVLPACIGTAMIWRSDFMNSLLGIDPGENLIYNVKDFAADVLGHSTTWYGIVARFLIIAVMMLFVLAAMIRLAYFNVMEEERQKTEGGAARKEYTGLPVTSSALIFPTVALLQYITKPDLTILYFVTMILTGFAFLSKLRIKKPGLKGIIIMVIIGAIEFIALILTMLLTSSHPMI